MEYQAKLKVPFGVLGIRCTEHALTGIDFLPASEAAQPPANEFAAQVCEQLRRYLDDPHMPFTLPLDLRGTPYRQKVWRAMQKIPRGQTRSYGELAAQIGSGAQAVGQACGANPIPIVVPCHRVVGKSGLGGFMQHGSGESLDIKRWLLAHEHAPSPLQGEGRGEGRSAKVPLSHPSDEAPSHSTRQQSCQVAGYPTSGRGEKK